MKINWTLFYLNIILWMVIGIIIFDDIIPMLILTICSGVGGSLIIATEKKKEKTCN